MCSKIRKWCSLLCMVLILVSCTSDIEPYGATLKESSGGSGGQDKTLSLSISPTTVTLSDQGEATAYVTASTDLSWTLADVPSWLSVSPKSGTGNATLTLTASAENPSTESRSATITVTSSSLNAQFTVTQPGVQLSVGSTLVSFTAAGGTQTLVITSNTSWSIQNNASSWLRCNTTTGKGNATISLTANENTSISENSGELIISGAGKNITVQVSQAGATPTLSVDQTTLSFVANGESKTVSITSNTSWEIESNVSWLTCDKTTGTGNATIRLTAAKNTTTNVRNGKLTIFGAGKVLTIDVSQEADVNMPSEDDNQPPKTQSARKQ